MLFRSGPTVEQSCVSSTSNFACTLVGVPGEPGIRCGAGALERDRVGEREGGHTFSFKSASLTGRETAPEGRGTEVSAICTAVLVLQSGGWELAKLLPCTIDSLKGVRRVWFCVVGWIFNVMS